MRHRNLVVNADDFGLAMPLSRGIIAAHKKGVVTSASCVVTADSFDESCRLAGANPSLDIGIHLVAVGGGRPVLPPSRIRSLLSPEGRFPGSWKGFLARMALGRIDYDELSQEFEAQIRRLLDHGVPPTHCDSHQHIHLLPPVARCVLDLARKYSIPFVRAPQAASWNLRSVGMGFFSRMLEKKARGRAIPSLGVECSGHLTKGDFLRLLGILASDRSPVPGEILAHPGHQTDEFQWGYDWEGELALLTDPALREEIDKRGMVLTNYRALMQG